MNYLFHASCLPFEDNQISGRTTQKGGLTILRYKVRWTTELSSSFFTYVPFFWKDRLQYYNAVTDYISPIPGLQAPAFPVVTSTVSSGQAAASQSLVLRSVKEMDREHLVLECSRS